MSDQTIQIKYVGTTQRWPELAITGRQSVWMPGQIESRSKAEAASLLATGLFSSPPVPVTAVTGPGGGNRLLAGNTPLWLQGVPLLDRVPLPTMRSIAEPGNLDIANAILTDGVTLAWVDAPGEMYGRALEITIPGAVTNKWVQIPLKPNFDGSYPKALQTTEFRINVPEFAPFTTLQAWLAQSGGANTASRVGYLFGLKSGSTGRYGTMGPYVPRWENRYRTYHVNPLVSSPQQSPAAWGRDNPEYEVRWITFSVTTTGPAKLLLNRVCSPEWSTAGVITQFDGTYASAWPLMQDMMRLGWPGVGSRSGGGAGDASVSNEQMRELVAAGWDIIQHVNNLTDAVPPVSQPMDGTMTAADIRRVQAGWARWMQSVGAYAPRGRRAVSHLQNGGPSGVPNANEIYRDMGVLTSRGYMPDAQWGYDPFHVTSSGAIPTTLWSGWASRMGRYNRRFCAGSDATTAEGRHIYAGSRLEENLLNTLSAKELSWLYFHNLQEYAPPTYPQISQSSREFAEAWKQHMIGEERAGRVVMLSVTQADLLTYDRPGDVYLRWDGAWVSRSSSAAEDERRVVL